MTRIEVPSETLVVEIGMLKITEDILKEQGQENPDDLMDILFDSWKSIVDKSETPWALCGDCYNNIQIYIKKH